MQLSFIELSAAPDIESHAQKKTHTHTQRLHSNKGAQLVFLLEQVMVDPKLKHAHLRFPHSTVQCVQVPILALGARVGTFLPVHVPQVWGAGGGDGEGGGGETRQLGPPRRATVSISPFCTGLGCLTQCRPRIKLDKKRPRARFCYPVPLAGGWPRASPGRVHPFLYTYFHIVTRH